MANRCSSQLTGYCITEVRSSVVFVDRGTSERMYLRFRNFFLLLHPSVLVTSRRPTCAHRPTTHSQRRVKSLYANLFEETNSIHDKITGMRYHTCFYSPVIWKHNLQKRESFRWDLVQHGHKKILHDQSRQRNSLTNDGRRLTLTTKKT